MEQTTSSSSNKIARVFAVLFYIVTVYYLIGGVLGLVGFTGFLSDASRSNAVIKGIVSLICALSSFFAGYGLWSNKKNMAIVGVIVFILLAFVFKMTLTVFLLKAF